MAGTWRMRGWNMEDAVEMCEKGGRQLVRIGPPQSLVRNIGFASRGGSEHEAVFR